MNDHVKTLEKAEVYLRGNSEINRDERDILADSIRAVLEENERLKAVIAQRQEDWPNGPPVTEAEWNRVLTLAMDRETLSEEVEKQQAQIRADKASLFRLQEESDKAVSTLIDARNGAEAEIERLRVIAKESSEGWQGAEARIDAALVLTEGVYCWKPERCLHCEIIKALRGKK
jgi:hypothetical protein